MMKVIKESRNLSRGIFWIKEADNIDSEALFFTIDCDVNGNALSDIDSTGISKNGQTYNHQRVWASLNKDYTDGESFNYYPRGRVEINNGTAIIYCSPYIYSDELKNWCTNKFNLTSINGINKVRMIADNSNHYKCHLDD